MALADKNRIYDGFDTLEGGVDAGRRSDAIDRNQCVSADNLLFRGGLPETRPGIRKLTRALVNNVTYDAAGRHAGSPVLASAAVLDSGIFQGAAFYSVPGSKPSIIAMIGGRMFQFIPQADQTVKINEISLTERNSSKRSLAYMVQADRYLIIQDGISKPIIFDGVTARRAALNEVPVGTIMAYGMGRLCVVVNGHEILIGDLYGSHDGEPAASVLQFTETQFLNEGGAVGVPSSFGKVRAMAFVPQQDSSTGEGELTIYAERGETSLFLSQPREQWKESAFQRVGLLNIGACGHRSLVPVNGDLWFRSDDGFRSYRQARSEINGWAHLPMSTEIRQYTENDSPELLDHSSAIEFNNLLIATVTPAANNGRPYHFGLVVLDFDVLSSFGSAARPAWAGHWTKMPVSQVVKGTFNGAVRGFVFGLDSSVHNQLFEISRADRSDYDGPITWELVGRDLTFDSPYNEKEMYGADIWLDRVTDAVTVTVTYRPDQLPDWLAWQTLPTLSPVGTPSAITPGGVPTIRKGFKPRQSIEKPDVGYDAANTKRQLRRGYSFQPRLQGTGHAAIRKFRMHAQTELEDPKAN